MISASDKDEREEKLEEGLFDEKKEYSKLRANGKALKLSIPIFIRSNLACQWKILIENNSDCVNAPIIPLPKSKNMNIRAILNDFKQYIEKKCKNELKKFDAEHNIVLKTNENNNNNKARRGPKRRKKKVLSEMILDANDSNNNENEMEVEIIEDLNQLSEETRSQREKLEKNFDVFCDVMEAMVAIFNHVIFRALLFEIECPQAFILQKKFLNGKETQFGRLIDKRKNQTIDESDFDAFIRNEMETTTQNEKEKKKSDLELDIDDDDDNDDDNDIAMSNTNNNNSYIEEPIDIFGAEHLVRLFVKLPQIVDTFSGFSVQNSITMKDKCNGLLDFLLKNKHYFEYCNGETNADFKKLLPTTNEYAIWTQNIILAKD